MNPSLKGRLEARPEGTTVHVTQTLGLAGIIFTMLFFFVAPLFSLTTDGRLDVGPLLLCSVAYTFLYFIGFFAPGIEAKRELVNLLLT
jgi:hypothetical protein